jgi:hypothetical protein
MFDEGFVEHQTAGTVEPPLGPGPLNAHDLLCVLVVDGHITGMPQRFPPRGAVSQQ